MGTHGVRAASTAAVWGLDKYCTIDQTQTCRQDTFCHLSAGSRAELNSDLDFCFPQVIHVLVCTFVHVLHLCCCVLHNAEDKWVIPEIFC